MRFSSHTKTLFLAVLLAYLSNANALETPMKSKADPRIQYVDYKSNQVVKVNGATGCITTIVFAAGEEVTNYGSGFSTAWEFSASGNNFFLKPKMRDGSTNLVIVTNKRIYNIDVQLVNKPKDATHRLTYTYTREAQKIKAAKRKQEEVENELNKKDPHVYETYPAGNWNYTENFASSEGSKVIAPVEVHDNGRFTYFKFRNNQDFPAVYKVSTDGESLVNYHVENGVMVVHGVYAEYRLRAGSDVVGVYNESYEEIHNQTIDVTPVNPSTVKGVVREIR